MATVHDSFFRTIFALVPHGKVKEVATMFKTIHVQESIGEARRKKDVVAQMLQMMKQRKASESVCQRYDETFSYYPFQIEQWKRIRTNNGLGRIIKEIRRRTRVFYAFPDGKSALMLVAARLQHVESSTWSSRKYSEVSLLKGENLDSVAYGFKSDD